MRVHRPDPTVIAGGVDNTWGFFSTMAAFGLIILGLLVYMTVTWPLETALMVGFAILCAAIGKLLQKTMG